MNEIVFVIACLCQKGDETLVIFIDYIGDEILEIFMYYGLTTGQYSCTVTQLFMLYWNFEYTKDVTLHCGKSGAKTL